MNLQTEKIEVVKLLLDNNDKKLISTIKALLEKKIDILPSHVIDEVKTAQEQIKNGQYTSHDQVMKKYAKYL